MLTALALAAGIFFVCSAHSMGPCGDASPRRPPRAPPPEAIAACKDLHPGDACTFVFEGERLTGRCYTPLGEVVCVPHHHPAPPASR